MRKVSLHSFLTLVVIIILLTSFQLGAQTRSIQVTVRTSAGKTLDLYRASYALVVGNGNYTEGWDPLPGAIRDVKEVAEVLERKGFEVTLKTDLTKDGFNRVLGEFVHEHGRNGNNRLFFYYAGHGIQVAGRNYLIPTKALIYAEEEVEYESVDVGFIMSQMEIAGNRMNIIILDACRNNPFARSWRSSASGLAFINAPTIVVLTIGTPKTSLAILLASTVARE